MLVAMYLDAGQHNVKC